MERLRTIFKKLVNRETILYVVFGVLTTLINLAVFALCSRLSIAWELGNGIAWIVSVLFAFITNKLFVFESKSFRFGIFLRELLSFFAARLFSLAVEYAGLWLLIDVLGWKEMLAKILMNIVVIILNYLLSKLLIFKKQAG
ncbi:GtrA family protein [Yeguia hominis]|uniref:GtrA family protein n=1 Tax=Yeguia hominis TaxID=2763662 RepID=A0A926DAU3_9FIRM|nr:GtrA family protein [Yeguia hominis]MBC8534643.1 GtrA family protein [Yeguia hominis]